MIFDPGFGCFLCLADICLLGALSVCVCVCVFACLCVLFGSGSIFMGN